MYIELVPEYLQKISYEKKEEESSTPVIKFDDTLPSDLTGSNQICRETLAKTDETNTKITTKITKNNVNTTTKRTIVVDNNTRSVFASLNCSLSDSDINAILLASNGNLSICSDAVKYVNDYKGAIENIVGFMISFIRKGGYTTISKTPKAVPLETEYKKQNYNMPYLKWLKDHEDEDREIWLQSAEEFLGYSLSEQLRNNIPEIHRLIEMKFKTKNEMKIAI